MDLPGEILLMISDRIRAQKDRIRLLSVCRRWHQLFFGKVYSCLHIEDDFDTFDGLARLAVSLFQNPRLALAVREFDTGMWLFRRDGYKKDIDITVFHLLLEQIGASSNDLAKWKDQLDNNDEDIWRTILIIMMKNLRVLKMGYMNSDFLSHVMTLVTTNRKPFDTDPALQHLEEVWANTVEIGNGYMGMDLIPFIHLPSMKVLQAHTLNVYDERSPIPSALRPAPASSGINELYFIDINTDSNGSSGFTDMIVACKSLRVFEYQHILSSPWPDGEVEFRSRPFYGPLSTQKHSLQVLRLNGGGRYDFRNPDCHKELVQELVRHEGRPSNDWFGSLHEFTALRELHIRLRNLLDFGASSKTPTFSFLDILPHSLEYLSIADYMAMDFDILMANFKAILACREDKFPALKKLDIRLHCCIHCVKKFSVGLKILYHVHNSFDQVEEAFQKVGIEFSCQYLIHRP
ncbi:hypothetical protein BDV33DRAFT_227431 [Aspergillus novoparasiticus]|uniref:F-box domain-containing protein n=1 Tax=Aspergillus novoparasiticus TaxID=986946 RepID=A0A5N6EH24_9EURO|nr:hypothetical protein BDV33DRAFT_227431 [Aspergillus novoparasiticus]